MTVQRLRQPDLLAVAGAAPVCAAVCVLVHLTLIRVVCAVPLAVMFPGYTITAALFARTPLEIPARVMLTLGLSLVTLVLGGLLLNFMPGGLRQSSWVILLLVVIGVAIAIAMQRRPAVAAPVRFPDWSLKPSRVVNAVILVIALVIGIGAVVESRAPLGAPNTVGYETLSMTPFDHDAGVRLQVSSARQHTTSYKLKLYVAAALVIQKTLRLAPGDSASISVQLPRSRQAREADASVVMLGGHWTPRRVNLTLPAA